MEPQLTPNQPIPNSSSTDSLQRNVSEEGVSVLQQSNANNETLQQWGIEESVVVEEDHRFDSYISMLKQRGAIISDKLHCGIFHLKNGLPYPGLYTKEQINPSLRTGQGKQQILVSMPVELLLTSQKAEHESPPDLHALFKQQSFYHGGSARQNRILVTYLLYLLQHPDQYEGTPWYQMANHLSKDVDILSFWDPEDLAKFTDKSIERAAKLERDNFEKDWKKFEEIQSRNQVIQGPMFSYDNYRWIYIHTISRCFGSYLNCLYFVPFCQFLNHNCVDVSYCCLEADQYQQKLTELAETGPTIEKTEEKPVAEEKWKEDISDISQDSGNSEDYIESNDFSYESVNSYIIKWNSKVSFNLKEKEKRQIEELHQKVEKMLEEDVLWKGFALLYIGEILEKNNVIVNQYMAERKKFAQAKQELSLLQFHIRTFRRHMVEYYKSLGSTYMRDKNAIIINNPQPQQDNKKISTTGTTETTCPAQQPSHSFTTFIMSCHSNQDFNPGSQVYFQYNRLSNRTLLQCYGFSLENNKYEHVWVRRSLGKEIGQYPDLFNKIQQKGVSIVQKVKLKPYVLNTELIVTEKVEKWKMYGNVSQQNYRDFEKMFGISDIDEQCEIITKILQIYESELPRYSSLVDLTCKSLDYHSYFRSVYQNQKIKILNLQIGLLKSCLRILGRVKDEKIQIKGNVHLRGQLSKICWQELKTKQLVKSVWGYLKMLDVGVVC